MVEKKYSAGLVSRRFWFYEFKQYLHLINEGKTDSDIKYLAENENLFGTISTSRAKEVYSTVKRRKNKLDEEIWTLFFSLDIENQKLVSFIAVLLLDQLFMEFMLEVYLEKVHKQYFPINDTDFRSFFVEKQRTNKEVSEWKQTTCDRLSGVYKNYLTEAGLIRDIKGSRIITPKILDRRVVLWLRKNNRLDIAKAISGEVIL